MFRSLCFASATLWASSLAFAQFPVIAVDGRELSVAEYRSLLVAAYGEPFLDKWELRLLCEQELAGRRARKEPVPDLAKLDAKIDADLELVIGNAREVPRIEGGEPLYELRNRAYTREALRFLIHPDRLFEFTYFDEDPNTWPDFLRMGLEEPTLLSQFEGMRLRALRLQAGDPDVKPFGEFELRIRRSVIEKLLRETNDVRRFGQPLPEGGLLSVNGESVFADEVWPLVESSLGRFDLVAMANYRARSELAFANLASEGTLPGPGERLRALARANLMQGLGLDLLRVAGVPSIDIHRQLEVMRLARRGALEAQGRLSREALSKALMQDPGIHPGTLVQASVILFASWDFETDRHLGADAHAKARERAAACQARLAAGESFDELREELCEYPVNLLTARRDLPGTAAKVPDCNRGAFEWKTVSDLEFFLGIRAYRILAGPPTFSHFPYERVVSPDSVGQILEPIEVPYGHAIVRIENVQAGPPIDLRIPLLRDQVKERVLENDFERFLMECVQEHTISIAFR